MKNLRIARSALGKRIFIGKVNKEGSAFTGEKKDVTSDVLKAVIEFVGENESKTVEVQGAPSFRISVERI